METTTLAPSLAEHLRQASKIADDLKKMAASFEGESNILLRVAAKWIVHNSDIVWAMHKTADVRDGDIAALEERLQMCAPPHGGLIEELITEASLARDCEHCRGVARENGCLIIDGYGCGGKGYVPINHPSANSLLRRAADALSLKGEWRLIESAPRDGTNILLWCKTWERGPVIGWTHGNDPWQEIPDRLDRPERRPTHWMLVPNAP